MLPDTDWSFVVNKIEGEVISFCVVELQIYMVLIKPTKSLDSKISNVFTYYSSVKYMYILCIYYMIHTIYYTSPGRHRTQGVGVKVGRDPPFVIFCCCCYFYYVLFCVTSYKCIVNVTYSVIFVTSLLNFKCSIFHNIR